MLVKGAPGGIKQADMYHMTKLVLLKTSFCDFIQMFNLTHWKNMYFFIKENAFQNVICIMAAIFIQASV